MVTTISRRPGEDRKLAPSLIVELVGPAGAGKSTLACALEQRNKNIALARFPYWREPGQLPFFVPNTLALLPTFMQLLSRRNGKRPRREEIAYMVILRGWPRVLRRPVVDNKGVLLIDQGPISMLATILVSDASVLNEPWADGWWCRMYRQWANTLDMVIWLDAPNTTLLPRIRGRKQTHAIKETPDPIACKFLDEWREIYEHIFSALIAERRDFKVHRFDTAHVSTDEVYREVSAVLGLNHRERLNDDD